MRIIRAFTNAVISWWLAFAILSYFDMEPSIELTIGATIGAIFVLLMYWYPKEYPKD